MSASPVLAVVLSAARLDGMAARKMKRTRVFASVAGYMPQRQSRHHAIYRQGDKGLASNNLFFGTHIWAWADVGAFLYSRVLENTDCFK